MKPEKCVCINLVYFVPKVAFNLYYEATVFGWSAIKEGWGNFAQYLVARGLGDMFVNTAEGLVVRMGLVGDTITRTADPVAMEESTHLVDADNGEAGRNFQLDRYHPTLCDMEGLFEIYPDADQFLGSQRMAYVAMAVRSTAVDNKLRQELISMVAGKECTEERIVAFSKICEDTHALRYVMESVNSNGYSIMGQAADKAGDPNSLYTVGLVNFGEGYEVYVQDDFPAFEMGILLTEVTNHVIDGLKVDQINERLKLMVKFKKYRPRLVRTRTVRIEEVFLHRLSDKFDTYRLMLDL